MPLTTSIGFVFIILGAICIAFTPKEKIVYVNQNASWGTYIVVLNSDATMAASASVPYYEPGKILKWDGTMHAYRWVDEKTK